jgi:hypothetical protein
MHGIPQHHVARIARAIMLECGTVSDCVISPRARDPEVDTENAGLGQGFGRGPCCASSPVIQQHDPCPWALC